MGTTNNLKTVKLNATLDGSITTSTKALLQAYKDIFAWNYTNLKGIPPRITQHCIKFNITIPLGHEAKYQMKPNYVVIIK